jgi:hypothetical protein
VRSASRYGRHVFGANASRIRSLLEDIEERISTADEKAARAAKPPPKPPAKDAKPPRRP